MADDLTEIVALDVPRVDGVGAALGGAPANDEDFLIIKQQEARPPEGFVPLEAATYEDLCKSKYSADELKSMLAKGEAMKNPNGDPSYPIGDVADLKNAIHAVGRGSGDHDKIQAYIMKRADALGQSDMIPDDWKSGVSKATQVMDDSQVPGSPSWEAEDARRLQDAATTLAAVSTQINDAMMREQTEVNAGHADDMSDVYSLQDALSAVQAALSLVAGISFTEAQEATGQVSKAREVSPEARAALAAIQGQLDELLAGSATTEPKTGAPGGAVTKSESEGDAMSFDITEEQFNERIAKAVAEDLEVFLKGIEEWNAAVEAQRTTTMTEVEKAVAVHDARKRVEWTEAVVKSAETTAETDESEDAATAVAKAREDLTRATAALAAVESGEVAEPVEKSTPAPAFDYEAFAKAQAEANAEAFAKALAPTQALVEAMAAQTDKRGMPLVSAEAGAIRRGEAAPVEAIPAIREAIAKSEDPKEREALGSQATYAALRAIATP